MPHTPSTQPDPSPTDWKVIGLVGVAHSSSHFYQLVIPALYAALVSTFDLDFARFGLLISVFYILSGIGQASSGFIVDRIGGCRVLWFGLGCFVVASLILAGAQNYAMLMLAAAVAGLGNSVFHPADFSILNQKVSHQRLGHAFSTHGLSGSLGWAAAPVLITGLSMLAGWRVAMLVVAALIAMILLATIVWRHLLEVAAQRTVDADGVVTTHPRPPAPGFAQTARALAASPALWGAFVFFGLTSVALSAIQNYTLPILGSLYQFSEVRASAALSGYMLAAAAGMLAGGFLANATPRSERVVAAAYLVGGMVLMLLASGVLPTWAAIPAVAAAGLCTGLAGPSRDMLIRRVTPKGAMGSVYGLVYSGMDVGAALAPVLYGVMMDSGWTAGPWIGAGIAMWLATCAATLIGWLGRRTAKAQESVVAGQRPA